MLLSLLVVVGVCAVAYHIHRAWCEECTQAVLSIDIEHGGPYKALVAVGMATALVDANGIRILDTKRVVFQIDKDRDIDPLTYREFYLGVCKGKLLPLLASLNEPVLHPAGLWTVREYVTQFYNTYPKGRLLTDCPSIDIGAIDHAMKAHLTSPLPLRYQPAASPDQRPRFRSCKDPSELIQGLLSAPRPLDNELDEAKKELWWWQRYFYKPVGAHDHDPVNDAKYVIDLYHLYLKIIRNRHVHRILIHSLASASALLLISNRMSLK